jgi:hypothetical protein
MTESNAPPGANPTTIVTGRSGYVCAKAVPKLDAAATATTTLSIEVVARFIEFSELIGFSCFPVFSVNQYVRDRALPKRFDPAF